MGRRSRSRRRSHSRRRRRSPSSRSSSEPDERRDRRRRRRGERPDDFSFEARRRNRVAAGPYIIPDAAPRMQVPSNLPVEVSSFIDLFSLFVSRGGPTLEEEVMFREKENPYFAFLRAPWNDPMNVYYRWRLYALLQEGQRHFMRWRTEPYQLEQGNDAVVWIPPPIIQDGTEHLSFLCDAVVQGAASGTSTLEAVLQEKQRPAALWMSRLVTNEESFFTSLRSSEVTQWVGMLNLESVWRDVLARREGNKDGKPASGDAHQALLASLEAFRSEVLSSAFISERMMFVVEHRETGIHTLSFVLDEVLRHVLGVLAVSETDQLPKAGMDGLGGVAKHLISILSLLFLLHDVCRNAEGEAMSQQEVERLVDAEEERAAAADTSRKGSHGQSFVPQSPAAAGGHASMARTRYKNPIIKGVEWIMPSIVEGLVRVTVGCCGAAHPGGGADCTPQGPQGLDVVIETPASDAVLGDYDPQPIVNLALSVPQQHHATSGAAGGGQDGGQEAIQFRKTFNDVRLLALQVLSWTRSLLIEWGDGGLVGSRCWVKLQESYGFLLCQPIEDVGCS